jgi:hypothetical protein
MPDDGQKALNYNGSNSISYAPLSDEEWERIQPIVQAISTEGTSRRGRPCVSVRTLVNAITHAISFDIPIKWVSSSVMDYPSRPTLFRYYKRMVMSGVMNTYVLHLSRTRPEFLEQYKQYGLKSQFKGGCAPTPPTEKELEKLRIKIITPVYPWGPPAKPYR